MGDNKKYRLLSAVVCFVRLSYRIVSSALGQMDYRVVSYRGAKLNTPIVSYRIVIFPNDISYRIVSWHSLKLALTLLGSGCGCGWLWCVHSRALALAGAASGSLSPAGFWLCLLLALALATPGYLALRRAGSNPGSGACWLRLALAGCGSGWLRGYIWLSSW